MILTAIFYNYFRICNFLLRLSVFWHSFIKSCIFNYKKFSYFNVKIVYYSLDEYSQVTLLEFLAQSCWSVFIEVSDINFYKFGRDWLRPCQILTFSLDSDLGNLTNFLTLWLPLSCVCTYLGLMLRDLLLEGFLEN